MTNPVTTPVSGSESPPTTAVDRFIDAIRHASFGAAEQIYSSDVRLDATVPGWRFRLTGSDAVRNEYGRWFGAQSEFSELRRHRTADGEVVEYFITWTENGVDHGAHHAHLLTVDSVTDRITDDHVFCGGRWPASLLAEMNAPSFTAAS